ncbi:chemotaxis protein CheB [uncultured Anaerovibrio sp.]|uniref:chemotaxis protein CheB n=1 Tax=uncultured Anaerovibrio sp. TaxID=361586 RepID=UPI00260AA615|nr:chemotaxis protein CheB [uncultured Anaerovibrio sp.]
MGTLRVFVIDNSIAFQNALVQELNHRLPSGSVIDNATSPVEAQKKLTAFKPTAIILNLALGAMMINQDKFLPMLVKQHPNVPIIVYGISNNVSQTAKFLGASAYFKKPSFGEPTQPFFDGIIKALQDNSASVRLPQKQAGVVTATKIAPPAPARQSSPSQSSSTPSGEPVISIPAGHGTIDLIAIGASTGGTEALSAILPALKPPLPGIVIVQHIPPMFSRLFSERLNGVCALTIKEAANGDVVKPNHVYIAPGGKHMSIIRQGSNYVIECKAGPPVHSVCPAVDILFDSVADVAGNKAMGVILTGIGKDGAAGLLKMRKKGSPTIGQDAATCTVYGMPKVAFSMGAVQQQLPLSSIPEAIHKIAR